MNEDLVNKLEKIYQIFDWTKKLALVSKKTTHVLFIWANVKGAQSQDGQNPMVVLAFNARERGVLKARNCKSNQELLDREINNLNEIENQRIHYIKDSSISFGSLNQFLSHYLI